LAKSLRLAIPDVETKIIREWPDAATLAAADSLVIYADGFGSHPANAHLAELTEFMNAGKGVVILHWATGIGNAGPKNDDHNDRRYIEWRQLIGAGFEPFYSLGHVWTANFKKPGSHPIMNGVKPFFLHDECYFHLHQGTDRKITRLLDVAPPENLVAKKGETFTSGNRFARESILKKREQQFVAWAFERPEGGRAFGFTGGHFHWSWARDDVRKMALNAIAWSAGLTIPETGHTSPTPTGSDMLANLSGKNPGWTADQLQEWLEQSEKGKVVPWRNAKVETPKKATIQKLPDGAQLLEGESLKVLKSVGSVAPQDLRSYGDMFSGSSHVWWRNGKPGDVIEFAIPVTKAGTYRIGLGMTKARDYGIAEFSLNGKPISKSIDFYNNDVIHTGTIAMQGEHTLTAGEHRLAVKMIGANPKALKSYMIGLDYVLLYSGDEAGLVAIDPRNAAPAKGEKNPKKSNVKAGNDLSAEPKSPEAQLADFVLPDGFQIELVASEVTGVPKPTSIAFDDAGRLWVTTAVEYPRDKDPEIWKKKGRDKIVIIDAPHLPDPQPVRTFAEGMVMPMSVLPYANGAYVAQGPEIFFLDADGQKDTLLNGFGVQDTHTMPHQLYRSPGGRITFSQGVLNNGTITDASGRSHVFDRTLIATINPKGTDLQITGVGMNNIWAWAQSRTGRVFIHEANDFGFGLVQFEEDSSYPSFRKSLIHPDAPLHPPTAKGLDLGGTGFSGIAISDDRAGSYPAPWHGRFFVANPIDGKINSATGELGTDDVWSFKKQVDLVACKDTMFRPVCITFGPDGCLYIADWYNRIISHNEVARDHPARDKGHGRIWRVRHKDQPRAQVTDFTKVPTDQLPAALNSDSTWAMRAAWHQIAQRQDKSVIPELVKMIRDTATPNDARIHALWTLEELQHFDAELWAFLLGQPSPDLRRESVRALSSLTVPQSVAAPLLKSLAGEKSWTVRYEVLRYFRRAIGPIADEHLAWLRQWNTENAVKTNREGDLNGTYQRTFQNFLLTLAETKTPLPVMPGSKWNGVISHQAAGPDPSARIAAVRAALPKADAANGKLLTKSICLSCHAIGGEGVGFAPPLDGSAKRDLDGLLMAIVDPNAAMESVFRSFRIETKDGGMLEGFNQGETVKAITLAMMGGAKLETLIEKIKAAGYIEGKSVMPDITAGLPAEQVADIVAYLRTVK
jgi:putative membrane-bound dehydrogenase-like protein